MAKSISDINMNGNAFQKAGFEVVASLPTTRLFEGREVMYQGKKYVYSSGWKEEITSNTMYEANLLWGGRNIAGRYSPIDASMMSELSANVMAFPNPASISIEYSRDGGVTWLDYGATEDVKVKIFTTTTLLVCGKADTDGLPATVGYQLRITITPKDCNLFTYLNKIIMNISTSGANNCWFTFKGLKNKDVIAGNEDDTYYDTIVNKAEVKGWPDYNVVNFHDIETSNKLTDSTHANLYYRLRLIFGYDTVFSTSYTGLKVRELRFFGRGRYSLPSNLARYNHLYSYDWQQNALFPAKVESKEVINFNVNNIEPTQTGNVTKTSTWLWQYLVQGVNWLKANKVALSVYNAKVAELVQADSSNNAYIQSVKEELTALIDEVSGGLAALAAVARSGSYNDLTDKPAIPSTFADLGGNLAAAQISEGSIANSKLVNSSMTLNGTTVNLGDTAILPWYVSYNGVDYPARVQDNWLQIYRHEVWANLLYLASQEPILPTNVVQITSLDDLSWYDERVSEYEIDSNSTFELLDGKVLIASQLLQCPANQLTLNLYPIPYGRYSKGALDAVISDLQKNNFAVFVENDLDTILASGSDFCVRIKVSKVPTYKAIIECYVAR